MIEPLVDTEVSFATFREAFGVDDDRLWALPVHVFRDGAVLVDTGFGPPGDDPFVPKREAHLDQLLDRAEIELVVLSHLHVDHVGWNMRDGEPFFPHARYVAHSADYEYFTTTRGDRSYVRDQIVDRDTEVRDGVALRHAPGHTPGHCIVDIGDVVVLADLAVHELQLEDPGIAYTAEADQALAAETRRRILREVAGRTVALSHFGIGQVVPDGEGFRWVASK